MSTPYGVDTDGDLIISKTYDGSQQSPTKLNKKLNSSNIYQIEVGNTGSRMNTKNSQRNDSTIKRAAESSLDRNTMNANRAPIQYNR